MQDTLFLQSTLRPYHPWYKGQTNMRGECHKHYLGLEQKSWFNFLDCNLDPWDNQKI